MPAVVRTWPSFGNRHVTTFRLLAEDDHVDGIRQSLAHYVAPQRAGVSTEMHLYAHGGHAFGLCPIKLPPALVEQWLHTIGVLADE